MIDEKTVLKLKQIANGLGQDWKVDLINASSRFITIKNGHHVELRLRKKWDTKYTYDISLYLMEKPDKYHRYMPAKSDKIILNHSTEKIVKYLISNFIPNDLNQQVIDLKKLLTQKEDNKNLEKYFIDSLNYLGKVNYPEYNHKICSVDLRPNVSENHKKDLIRISHSRGDIYNLSTELSRDNIIKVIGFIKGLIENES